MGPKNSSATRVQPVFHELLDRHWQGASSARWLSTLWSLAAGAPEACAAPEDFGQLSEVDAPRERIRREGRVFERRVAPPDRLLEWLLRNPEAMTGPARRSATFGCSTESAAEWRRRLFGNAADGRAQAQAEGLAQLRSVGATGSRHEWWAFEGFTALDCCLITDRVVLVVEGKRTEPVSTKVLWYPSRNQLWRNVEAAQRLAGDRAFGVIVGVEEEDTGLRELASAMSSLDSSCPHLEPAERRSLARHLLGFVTWKGMLQRAFELPEACFPDAAEDSRGTKIEKI